MELWWRLLSYLTLIDKVTLTYANKELYFIVHSNQNLKRELDFIKCIAKNNNWDNFLNLKFDEILNNFRQKVYCDENVYSYINLRFLFVSMKRNLCKSDIYSHMFYCLRINDYSADCKYCICSDFFSYCGFTKSEEQEKIWSFHLSGFKIDVFSGISFQKVIKK